MTHTISAPLAHLRNFPQFVICKFVPSSARPGKTDKIPVDPVSGRNVSAMDPANWMAAEAAEAAAQRLGQGYGIGFSITPETRVFCGDIDGALQPDGAWRPDALALCARFPNAGIEISNSKTGLHIWGVYEGEEPPHAKKNAALGLELYTADRFIALGGDASGNAGTVHTLALQTLIADLFPAPAPRAAAPAGVSSIADDELITLMLGRSSVSRDGRPTLGQLWAADPLALGSAYPETGGQGRAYDASSADAALMSHLAFWCARDAEQMERLARRSALAREKWDRADYLPRTILNAVKRQEDVYTPGRPALPGDAAAVFSTNHPGGLPAGAVTDAPASRQNVELSFMAASSGTIPGSIEKVIEALTGPESGILIARDEFLEQIIFTDGGSAPRQMVDEDLTDLRARFGRRGFKPITSEIMRSAVHWVARHNKFDSAVQWAESLVWDGVPRIDLAMSAFYGAEDTPYSRAVGAYLFTALAGRCLVPGVKADMAVILIGLQGAAKTSSVEALAPTPESFGEVDLKMRDTDLARSMRGKLVLEMAELNGLAGRDQEAAKAWISRRVEEWTPKFKEVAIRYPRRCVLVGTGNAPRFLDDETGARRFLPIDVGPVDAAALRTARDQLWAEGVARFRAEGIAWQQAEALAKAEHGRYQIVDEREALVAAWLAAVPPAVPGQELAVLPRSAVPVRPIDVAMGALNYLPSQFNATAQKQIARIMKNLGYAAVKQRINGRPENTWVRTGT